MGVWRKLKSAMALLRAASPFQLPHFYGPTVPKVWVTETSALQLSTVWACVSVRSGSMSSLPWRVYERDEGGDQNIVDSDPTD